MESPWTGQTIGGYQLAEEIGHGSVAAVYRAYQPQLERWVAIKLLRINEAGGKEFLQRFRREARAIAALRHPNILSIYDYGEEGELAYIVMEYVPAGSLTAIMKGDPLPCLDALNIVVPLGDALAYAHSQGIVHRDIKPANILLPRPDWPLIADFGLVKVMGAQKKITQPGSVLGTTVYLSPEQVSGQEVDHRTDIYSLGILLYELVAGRLPFGSGTLAESMLARLYQDPVPPRQVNSEIPATLESVILRALERDPQLRYPSMEKMVNDLIWVKQSTQPTTDSLRGEAAAPMITAHLGPLGVVSGPQFFIATSGVALPIPPGEEILIGRRDPRLPEPPDLDLEPYGAGSAGVSRHHAKLLHRPEGWFLEDLQSTNGTYVNEVRLLAHRPVGLRAGDMIRFAQLTLIFMES